MWGKVVNKVYNTTYNRTKFYEFLKVDVAIKKVLPCNWFGRRLLWVCMKILFVFFFRCHHFIINKKEMVGKFRHPGSWKLISINLKPGCLVNSYFAFFSCGNSNWFSARRFWLFFASLFTLGVNGQFFHTFSFKVFIRFLRNFRKEDYWLLHRSG